MNTVSVICRAYDAEAPYIKSFIEHYLSIGCIEIHIVVPKGNPCNYLEIECQKFTNVKLYIDYKESKEFNDTQNIALQHITSTHIIWVDVDEYLDITDITPLLQYDYVRLNWVIAPFFEQTTQKNIPGFIDRQCKYIVKTKLCKKLNIHDCELTHLVEQHETDVKLLHYVYRSFNDLYLKCTIGKYGSYQITHEEQLIKGLHDAKQLPLKFKMAAIYQRIANAAQTSFPNYCKIDYKLENTLIKNTLYAKDILEYKKALMHYSSRIDLNKFIKEMLKHKNYRLYGRIPHHILAQLADKTLLNKIEPETWITTPRKRFGF